MWVRKVAACMVAGIVVLTFSGCGDSGATPGETSDVTPASAQSPRPTSTPTPTPTSAAGPRVYAQGESVDLPSAAITIFSGERAESIERNYDDPLTPASGGTLWLLKMNWTNLSNEAVSKVCWGPYTVDVSLFDTQGREMLLDNGSGGIVGNECSTGLMTGQSGDWYAAYQGLADAEIGYAVLSDHRSEPVAVAFADGLTLTFDS